MYQPVVLPDFVYYDVLWLHCRESETHSNYSNFEETHQNVEFFLAPTKKNAVDRAIFLIDGELVEVGILNYKKNVVMMEMFHEVLVAPNESKKIYLMTMPQAGCFYPVDIVLKAKDV